MILNSDFCIMIDEVYINKGLIFSITIIERLGKINKYIIYKDSNNNISLKLFYTKQDSLQVISENQLVYKLKFQYSFIYLIKYISKYSESYQDQFPEFEENELCINMKLIIHEIVNCKLKGIYRKIFLESKALALLLCIQKNNTKPQNNCTYCKFLDSPVEKDKIYKAKEIILNRLNNPLTISKLSLEVGLNECYLKKGFKEIFGTTVYEFVQEQRMLNAKLLLSTTDYSVSRVADEVGFSSVSNFSSAFKKHFGIFPSEIKKQLLVNKSNFSAFS